MAPNCKLVFEPDNLDNASPATVSRMGMVFMSSSVMTWKPMLDAWLKRYTAEADELKRSFSNLYGDAYQFLLTKLTAKMNLLEAHYIQQTLSILDGLLDTSKTRIKVEKSKMHVERLFLFSLMWSLGAVLESGERLQFEQFVTKHKSKPRWPTKSSDESIFEYMVDENGNWAHWSTRVEEFFYPSGTVLEYASILVPNVDNVRIAYLIDLIAKQKKGVLLIGEQGTAKTVMIKTYMLNSTRDQEDHFFKTMNFSSATTPNMFQRIIESYVEKRVGLIYGPPSQSKLSVFIDDVNMPVVNEWGDQVTNEIVRQLMEQGGFYSLERPGDFVTILDLQFLAAMIHPGGGRNDIPNRLKRRFCVFNCTLPSDSSMDKIFSKIATGYFCTSRFDEEIVGFIPNLVALTRMLWQQTKAKMLPTPAKFHYVFNLRDLSRIWEGILKIQRQECSSVGTVLKLWRHECLRVISDRFTSFEDKEWFDLTMTNLVGVHLSDHRQSYTDEETYFVDFLRDAPEPTGDEEEDVSFEAPKIYEEMPSFESVKGKVIEYMLQFNEVVRDYKLDLVFFHDCLVHLIIISRIIRTSRGNALLVGVGGSGKQSVTRLASFIAGHEFFQIKLTRAYNNSNLVEDLKHLYRTAGLAGRGISFIFSDNEIKEESFLEYLNNILSSGEVANLFTKEEIDEIVSELDPIMKQTVPKIVRTRDICYDFFINRARENLHIVLCFSPIGEKFRTRALKFPGLISGCTIDWFQKWPEDARVSVSKHCLQDYLIVCTDDVRVQLIEMMSFVHNYIGDLCVTFYERFRRQSYVTPKTLLSFLESFKSLYKEKYDNIQVQADRMEKGLLKLVEAAESIEVLKLELIEKVYYEIFGKLMDEEILL